MISEETEKNALDILSEIVGWIYFIAWSVSFYGQVIENYRRGKVSGLNFDFEVYNLIGFTGYSIYNIVGYVLGKDNKYGTGEIHIQDVLFPVHAVAVTIVILIQIVYYYDKTDPKQKVSLLCWTICGGLIIGSLIVFIIEQYIIKQLIHNKFNIMQYLGWAKAIISFIKYIPQAISNYKRKSTIGWNIHNILLDLTGGVFSFLQNFIDFLNKEFHGVDTSSALNVVKYALSFVAVGFDLLFIVQHYCLYKDSNSDLGKKPEVVGDTITTQDKDKPIIPDQEKSDIK